MPRAYTYVYGTAFCGAGYCSEENLADLGGGILDTYASPGCAAPVEQVPLDLLARQTGDVDRGPASHLRTGLAARSEPGRPHLAHEAPVTA